jgi:hypothetical protein
MAKVEPTEKELKEDAEKANAAAPKNPADAAREKLLKEGSVADRQAEIVKLQAEIDELQKPPKVEYPKMKYHPDQPATTVTSAEQEKKLGSGWVDSLADLPGVKARLKGTTAAEGPAKVAHDETAAGAGRR